jgi:hypothetical protein
MNMRNMHMLDDNWVLVLDATIALFYIPDNRPVFDFSHLSPVALFDFPFPLEILESSFTGYRPKGSDICRSALKPHGETLSVLIYSLDDGFDAIHHYVFDLETPQPDGSPPAIPIRFPPTCVGTIYPLPSCRSMYISPSGRGFWLETRNLGSKTRSYPARCVVPIFINCTSKQQATPDLREERQVDLVVGPKYLYARPCRWRDLVRGRQRISSVVMDDSMGRLAVVDVDGTIEILNYA